MTVTLDAKTIADASAQAMQELVHKHSREYGRMIAGALRTPGPSIDLTSKPAPTRSASGRQSHADVKVYDSNGVELIRDVTVTTPDGKTGTVKRFNRSQGRVVVELPGGELKMITARRLTVK